MLIINITYTIELCLRHHFFNSLQQQSCWRMTTTKFNLCSRTNSSIFSVVPKCIINENWENCFGNITCRSVQITVEQGTYLNKWFVIYCYMFPGISRFKSLILNRRQIEIRIVSRFKELTMYIFYVMWSLTDYN